MAEKIAYREALTEGNFQLSQSISKPGNVFFYRLSDKRKQKELLTICCYPQPAGSAFVVINRIESHRPGNINYFPRLIEMIRKDIGKKNPFGDIVSAAPDLKMKKYYYNRLGATRKMSTGYIHFPQKLIQRRGRKK